MTSMDMNEAARALFFLQTSPVISSSMLKGKSRPPKVALPSAQQSASASAAEASKVTSRSVSIAPEPCDDGPLKPGSALMALLNLNKLCNQQHYEPSALLDEGARSPSETSSPPAGSPTSPRGSDASQEMQTRDRSESVAVVEKRFSSDAMSIGQSKIGHYSREERRRLIDRFLKKRNRRIWRKRVKYDVRKSFADSRLRVKGRFVRKEDEDQLRELLILSF